ncbi:protein KASH5 [Sarcoramphus papa]
MLQGRGDPRAPPPTPISGVMAAEGPPAPSPHTPGTAVPSKEAALPAVEAETLQDPLQTAHDSAATRQGDSCCSEEFVLNHTFAVCDPKQTGCRKNPPADGLPPPTDGEAFRVPPRLLLRGIVHGAGHQPRVREGVAPQTDTPPCATGTVLAQRVVEYLQAVTGQSGEEGQLRALHHMLDPEAAGAALDLPTFHAVMKEWIASCQQEGGSWLAEERDAAAGDLGLVLAVGEGRVAPAAAQLEGDGGNTDITSPTEAAGLRSRAEQLAAQNVKLQRDAESAEELNACLAEETAQLKAQLRCSQQALDQARAATEELEDLKAMAKGLEKENGELRRQARQLEKEQRCLCSRADSLQEENQRLLTEGHGLRERIQALAAETSNLEAQLCHCTALVSSRDTALAQAGQRVEALSVALEEYDGAVQVWRTQPHHAPRLGVCSPPTPPGHREPHTGGSQSPRATGRAPKWPPSLGVSGRSPLPQQESLWLLWPRCRVQAPSEQPVPGGCREGPVPSSRTGDVWWCWAPPVLPRQSGTEGELRLETTRLRSQLDRMQDAWAMWPWCPLGEADVLVQPLGAEIEATCRVRAGAWEEEEVGTAAPGAPAGDGEEPAEPRQYPGPSESRLLPPRALLALLLLLALLALLCLLPRRWLGLPHSRATWPQLQLCYRRPPPL